MATSSGILRDCTHISLNENIKSQNNVTFKLVKTGKWKKSKTVSFTIPIIQLFVSKICAILNEDHTTTIS